MKDEKKEVKKKENQYASKIIDGVEVVDVKAIPIKVDKFGIPSPEADQRKTWDKI